MLESLTWEAWTTLGIIALMMILLVRGVARPDLVLLGCLGLLLVTGILSPEEAFAGLSNSAVLAVAALFVVAAGIQNTGALSFADRLLFPRSKNLALVTGQLMLTTASMSAFLNNTPIVAMLIPRVQAWCDKTGVPPSKLMIPLSFGAIVGGMTTLVGTSTNLLVAGLMESSGYKGLGMFDLAWVGVPAALGAILYFATIGHRLLPDRREGAVRFSDGVKDCLFELRVALQSPLVGQTVEEAGLRALEDAYLVHLRRGDELIPSSPGVTFRAGDVLTFLGHAEMLDRLLSRSGLEQARESVDHSEHTTLSLFEAVISPSSHLVGRSLRQVGFRELYQGVVLGIRRRDAAIEGPLARIPLQAGDLLIIEAHSGFDKRWEQNHDDFYLVVPKQPEAQMAKRWKAPLSLAILLAVVVLAAAEIAPIVTTAFVGALLMILTGCLPGREARAAVDVSVLLVIAAALGLGRAIESTGLAAFVAHAITMQAPVLGTVGVVAAVYFATSLLTELITNNAAAALMLGVGLASSQDLGVPPEAFAIAVAIAASASFLTPLGYQTNLMVLAAGGYRFGDFIKTGLYVNLIVAAVAITMIWLVWL